MSFGFGKNSGPSIPTSGTPSFGFFPPPPSSTPSAPFPDSEFSAGPSPRTFDVQAEARPHSFLDSTSPLKSSSQLHDAQIRAPFLHKGDMQNPVTRDFGSNSKKRSFGSTPQYLGAGMSSNFPQFQNSESSRSPPIQYNEDFLRDPGDDIMERNADTSSGLYDNITSQRRKTPSSTAADLHSTVHPRPWSNSQRC